MILERKQRGNRTYLTFFLQKKKKIRTQTLNPSLFDREIIQNNIFIQETFVASWKTMFFDRKLLLLHSIKKKKLSPEEWFCKFLKLFCKLIFTDKCIPSTVFTQNTMWNILWNFSIITRFNISKPSFTFVILEQFFDLRS